MNGLSSVKTNYSNNYNYYLNTDNNRTRFASYEEQNSPNPEKAVLTAGILQAFALFLHKASEWCGNKLMQARNLRQQKIFTK